MSLYLPEQKLGSHSSEGGSSNKFMLKGRQTGAMHRGHSWVFRAESYDTMMAWYEDIKSLTEGGPQERNAFVRSHARSFSSMSQRAASISSDGMVDEEDDEPFSAGNSAVVQPMMNSEQPRRPEPGGRFPSDIQVDPARGLQVPLSPSSAASSIGTDDRNAIAFAANLPGSGIGGQEQEPGYTTDLRRSSSYGHSRQPNAESSHTSQLRHYAEEDGVNPYTYQRFDDDLPNTSRASSSMPTTVDTSNHENKRLSQSPTRVIGTDGHAPFVGNADGAASNNDYVQYQNAPVSAGTAVLTSEPVSSGPEVTTIAGSTGIAPRMQTSSVPAEAPPSETIAASSAKPQGSRQNSVSHLHLPGEFPQ
jgi:hypothetical protein